MIVHSVCSTCFQTYNLLIQASDVELLSQLANNEGRTCWCPRLCGGEINLVGEPTLPEGVQLSEPLSLTAIELYQAVNGMGLPDEVPQSLSAIEAFFKAYKVREVKLETYRGGFFINEIHLEGGIVIHLTSGAIGARVLKITKEKDNGHGTSRGGTGSDRAQAGQPPSP